MTGIFFGSTTGNTEDLAGMIADKLDVSPVDIHNVGGASASATTGYDILLLGSSTWGLGELQDDWEGFLSSLKKENLAGKKVGLFGCGDSGGYPDTFCDAVGIIREELDGTGCTFVGAMDAAGYSPADSKAFDGGMTLGLLADDDEPGKTKERLEQWAAIIRNA